MASEQLKTVLELVGNADLGTLTLQERRALMDRPARRCPRARRSIRSTRMAFRSRAAVDVMLTPDGAREAADWYLAGQDARHPYASPLYADLRGLPPILIQAGDAEILRDDSLRFAAAAQAVGVDVTLEICLTGGLQRSAGSRPAGRHRVSGPRAAIRYANAAKAFLGSSLEQNQ